MRKPVRLVPVFRPPRPESVPLYAPRVRYAVKYKLGRATLEQMEYGVGKMTEGYLTELSRSKRVASVEQLVDDFWDRYYARIKLGTSLSRTM